jgi:arsenite methyltransferase
MLTPGLVYTFVREVTARGDRPREPEPDLVMDGPDEVAAYAHAGRVDGVMAASYLFHAARISQTIQGCKTVLDLGCGPATQLALVAQANPDVQFVGADLSDEMLGNAREHLQASGVRNVSLMRSDIADLARVADASMDGVISTMALHHLPRRDILERSFAEMRRVLKPGGAVYLTDFGRLKRLHSIIYFAYLNRAYQPHLFSLDYERSLRAAYLRSDFAELAQRFLPGTEVHSTFGVPFLVVVKTPDRPLSAADREAFARRRAGLIPRYRRDLDNMRTFFKLGGLGNDPFA